MSLTVNKLFDLNRRSELSAPCFVTRKRPSKGGMESMKETPGIRPC